VVERLWDRFLRLVDSQPYFRIVANGLGMTVRSSDMPQRPLRAVTRDCAGPAVHSGTTPSGAKTDRGEPTPADARGRRLEKEEAQC